MGIVTTAAKTIDDGGKRFRKYQLPKCAIDFEQKYNC
jgi:hypothetical protein